MLDPGGLAGLLDEAKRKLDCANDAELADALEVYPSRISNYRRGNTLPNAWMTRRIARVLDVSPGYVVAVLRRQRGWVTAAGGSQWALALRTARSARFRRQARSRAGHSDNKL